MLKKLHKKLKNNYIKKSHEYYMDIISSLEDTKKERNFSVFLNESGFDLETYISFSPQKLIEDYYDYISPFYKTAERDFLLLTSEPFHIFASIVSCNQTKVTLLYLNELINAYIQKDKEDLIKEASEIINQTMINMSFEDEDIH